MKKFSFTKTKLVCTIGPASDEAKLQKKMIMAGMDIARLNFSHGDHGYHERNFKQLHKVAQAVDKPLALLQDLQGPKIRLGTIDEPFHLRTGSKVALTGRPMACTPERLYVSYAKLASEAGKGHRILIDDGLIELRVDQVKNNELHCRVIIGGLLKSRKGVNLPYVPLSIPAMTTKDKKDAAFGVKLGVDFIALSFVRTAQDVIKLKNFLKKAGMEIPIIAKIEKPEALEDLDNIIDAAWGIMVARGDLGVETSAHEVPIAQKDIIARCNLAGKPVITATQMLESMTKNARPTRAEANDVANAVFDGTDAVMLSAETASGDHPLKAVEQVGRIVEYAETNGFPHRKMEDMPLPADEVIAAAAVNSAARIGARYIIPFTYFGYSARLVSKYRPGQPILAFAHDPVVARRLQLNWGVETIIVADTETVDEMFQIVNKELKKRGLARRGERVIITAGVPFGAKQTTNMMKIMVIE